MSAVGKSLQNAKRKKALACRAHYISILQAQQDLALFGPKEEEAGKKLKSIWETNDMDTFLQIADNRETGYLAERNVRVVVSGAVHIVKKDKVVPLTDDRDWFKLSEQLTIPKRPQWSFDMPAAELQRKEKAGFLEWRRSLAGLEENHKVLLTPYEKNLEVWRQLWRVIERSDVLLEILDCRNPLAFRSMDFEKYAQSTTNKHNAHKPVILLLNKADLLTENQRKAWANYFQSRGEKFYFFSAKPLDLTVDRAAMELSDDDSDNEGKETNALENDLANLEAEALAEVDDDTRSPHNSDASDVSVSEQEARLAKRKKDKARHQSRKLRGAPVHYVNPYELEALRRQAKEAKQTPQPKERESKPQTKEEKLRSERIVKKINEHRPYDILSAEDLLDHLATFRQPCNVSDVDTPLVVGMVGYPNVGKSSTINAIIGCKKVVVSATPGKTKHFQTLVIPNERRVMLCDCPGLVFPSFASTREQMVCDGVLPIDTVKDYVSPVAVICQRIPRQVFEEMYAVSLLAEDDIDESTCIADRLLNAVARRKGYMTDHDKPNRSKLAKEILKMYVDGVFVYAHPPPGLTLEIPEEWVRDAPSHSHSAAEPVQAHTEADEGDDGSANEDEVWEDISSADDARALSQDGHDDDDDAYSTDEEDVAPPMFFARPRGCHQLTQDELFNIENNLAAIARCQRPVSTKKRPKNHQLEPEVGVLVHEDGERELLIDSDDGIVAFDHKTLPRHVVQQKEKQKSKRASRREAKRSGLTGPQAANRVFGIESFQK